MHCTFAADLKKAFPDMAMTAFRKYWIVLIFSGLSLVAFGQHEQAHPAEAHQNESHEAAPAAHGDAHAAETGHSGAEGAHEAGPCGHSINAPEEFNAGDNAVHHIADANALHIVGDVYLNLPIILYAPGQGWTLGTTGAFHAHHHGNGANSHNGYVLVHGSVMRIKDAAFHNGDFEVSDYTHREETVEGKVKTIYAAVINGQCVDLDNKTTFDGGLMGGGITSFYDYSITRNVFTMLLTVVVLFFLFRAAATAATRRQGQAPKGLQNFIEPFYTFLRDEVAKPNIGPKYEKYMPYLLSAFFFILGLNLIGQVPFFPGSANVTGNISVTIVLALLTFLISTFSANKHFWAHTLWMPGVPAVLKIFILTPIEVLGLFLKPFTLLLRLFANITAGHIVILSFVSLIFIFGKAGESVGGSVAGAAASIPLTLFMMTLELLVAFLQAFIFTMLSSVYIGTAIEEAHHDDHH
jgi:F-type H+-transporting ATPase subunit a